MVALKTGPQECDAYKNVTVKLANGLSTLKDAAFGLPSKQNPRKAIVMSVLTGPIVRNIFIVFPFSL